jgi:surfeit locus 1 family protein
MAASTEEGRRALPRWQRVALLLLAAGIAAGFVRIGLWQADKGERKAALIGRFEAAAGQAEPEPLAQALAAADAELPRRTHGRVEFPDELPWLLLDNQRHQGRIGVRAYRIGASAGRHLLVEFGWLPFEPQRQLPGLPAAAPPAELEGLLLAPPSAGLRLGTAPALQRGAQPPALLTWLDPQAIGQQLGIPLPARVLRPAPELAFGFARSFEALPNTLPPERHHGYAVQWYGLAAAVAAIALWLTWRSRDA